MIIDEQNAKEYLIRPTDAVPVTLTVQNNKVIIDFEIEQNCDYVVVIKDVASTDEQIVSGPFIYGFTSTYTPLFATTNQVKMDISKALVDISDDLIYSTIRSNSIDVQYMASQTYVEDNFVDWNNPPYAVKQYVRYKTDCDLIVNMYAGSTTQTGNTVQLGDFSYSGSSAQSTLYYGLLGELKKRTEYWRKRIGSAPASPRSYVKGGSNWPDYLTRTF
jgi:hypothetical protein